MNNYSTGIALGLILFFSSMIGGLPEQAEAYSIAYNPNTTTQYTQPYTYNNTWVANPTMNYQYPYQYDYWTTQQQYTYPYNYNTGYTYTYTQPTTYNYGYDYNTYNNYDYYTYQQQLAQWQYAQQLAQYNAVNESNYYYNNVVSKGGYPYYVPACSYDDKVHSTCHQYQFTAELWGANSSFRCEMYGECWQYSHGWPYAI